MTTKDQYNHIQLNVVDKKGSLIQDYRELIPANEKNKKSTDRLETKIKFDNPNSETPYLDVVRENGILFNNEKFRLEKLKKENYPVYWTTFDHEPEISDFEKIPSGKIPLCVLYNKEVICLGYSETGEPKITKLTGFCPGEGYNIPAVGEYTTIRGGNNGILDLSGTARSYIESARGHNWKAYENVGTDVAFGQFFADMFSSYNNGKNAHIVKFLKQHLNQISLMKFINYAMDPLANPGLGADPQSKDDFSKSIEYDQEKRILKIKVFTKDFLADTLDRGSMKSKNALEVTTTLEFYVPENEDEDLVLQGVTSDIEIKEIAFLAKYYPLVYKKYKDNLQQKLITLNESFSEESYDGYESIEEKQYHIIQEKQLIEKKLQECDRSERENLKEAEELLEKYLKEFNEKHLRHIVEMEQQFAILYALDSTQYSEFERHQAYERLDARLNLVKKQTEKIQKNIQELLNTVPELKREQVENLVSEGYKKIVETSWRYQISRDRKKYILGQGNSIAIRKEAEQFEIEAGNLRTQATISYILSWVLPGFGYFDSYKEQSLKAREFTEKAKKTREFENFVEETLKNPFVLLPPFEQDIIFLLQEFERAEEFCAIEKEELKRNEIYYQRLEETNKQIQDKHQKMLELEQNVSIETLEKIEKFKIKKKEFETKYTNFINNLITQEVDKYTVLITFVNEKESSAPEEAFVNIIKYLQLSPDVIKLENWKNNLLKKPTPSITELKILQALEDTLTKAQEKWLKNLQHPGLLTYVETKTENFPNKNKLLSEIEKVRKKQDAKLLLEIKKEEKKKEEEILNFETQITDEDFNDYTVIEETNQSLDNPNFSDLESDDEEEKKIREELDTTKKVIANLKSNCNNNDCSNKFQIN